MLEASTAHCMVFLAISGINCLRSVLTPMALTPRALGARLVLMHTALAPCMPMALVPRAFGARYSHVMNLDFPPQFALLLLPIALYSAW